MDTLTVSLAELLSIHVYDLYKAPFRQNSRPTTIRGSPKNAAKGKLSCWQLNDKFLHDLKYKLYNHHPVCIGDIFTFIVNMRMVVSLY